MGYYRVMKYIERQVPFSIDEFCIEGVDSCPDQVREKIWRHHITPMTPVRHKLGLPLTASEKSCYRSKEWELNQGRSGNSQHTFGVADENEHRHYGACDWTFANEKDRTIENMDMLLKLIMDMTRYTRVCRYHTFIHCDYGNKSMQRQVFEDYSDGTGWKFRYSLPIKKSEL